VVAQAVAGLRQAADERARQAELDRVRVEGEKVAVGVEGGRAAAPEVMQDLADGLRVAAQVGGDARRRPAGLGEQDHL
jgi:hypothetical protein